jgi:hypothetical protein
MGLMNDDTSTSKYNISMEERSRDAMYRHLQSGRLYASSVLAPLHISLPGPLSSLINQRPSRYHYINLPSPNYGKIKLTLGFLIKQMRNGNQKPEKKIKEQNQKGFHLLLSGNEQAPMVVLYDHEL